ncbi:MAG: helix-turn-helix transcriptional regulator [Rhodospirillales bacterium]|nr:helix-turn-helix transcriptional regulator [Rhodospirillales bacterium]
MVYVVEYLAEALKAARAGKKLSQRGLSKATGMPQAQISKIENAAVDLKASTLIELARALDLEVMLVPRKHVPAVNSLIGLTAVSGSDAVSPRPAYALGDEDDDG